MGLDAPRQPEETAQTPISEVADAGVAFAPAQAPLMQLSRTIGNAAFARAVADGRIGRGATPRATGLLQRGEGGEGGGTATAPAPPANEELYTLTLSDGIHGNLRKDDAIALLANAEKTLSDALDFEMGEYALVNKERQTFFGAIGGALTDLAGKDFPGYEECWGDAYNLIVKARHELRAKNVQGAGNELRAANDAFEKGKKIWYAYKAQLDTAGKRAQAGIVVVAVLAVAVIMTGGAVAAALAPEAGVGAGGIAGAGAGGAGAGGMGVAGGGGAGAGAGGIAGAGGAGAGGAGAGGTAVMGGAGGGAVVGGGVATPAALADTAAAGAGAGTATVPGVGGATADAIVGTAIGDVSGAMTTGGPAAARAVAQGISVGVLEIAWGRLSAVVAMNAPLVTKEAQALKAVADIIFEVWKGKVGLPRAP